MAALHHQRRLSGSYRMFRVTFMAAKCLNHLSTTAGSLLAQTFNFQLTKTVKKQLCVNNLNLQPHYELTVSLFIIYLRFYSPVCLANSLMGLRDCSGFWVVAGMLLLLSCS